MAVKKSQDTCARFLRSIRAVRDASLYRGPVLTLLVETPASETVETLRTLMTRLDAPGAREGYLALIQWILDPRGLSYQRTEALYRAACEADFDPVRFLLLRAPARLIAKPDEVMPDPALLEVPLGRRKWLARGREREMLQRLMMDPDPSVLVNLLQNPMILEPDVVRIAARRPNLEGVFRLLALHARWSPRYAVQHAMVQNPYTPTEVAVAFCPLLSRTHTLEVSRDARLHSAVREMASQLRQLRSTRATMNPPVEVTS